MPASNENMSVLDAAPIPARVVFGEVEYPAGKVFGPRVQADVQLFIVDTAQAVVTANGRDVPVRAGQVACLRPGRREVFHFDADQATRHSWVALSWHPMPRRLKALVQALPDTVLMSRQMQAMVELGLADAVGNPRLQSSDSGWRVHLGVAFFCAWIEAARTGERTPPAPEPVLRARRFIHAHLSEPIELADVAEVACVSENHLVRLFRKHTGTTPMRYLWRCRVDRGAELLRQTGLSVSEIAYQVGFSTPYHFSRLVRQQLGMPPRQLRAAAWKAQ